MESMENDKKNNGSKRSRKENNHHLRAVAMEESGEGFPYAPENWPNPGDTWSWKVGRRVGSTGYFQDRYLYVPKHLRRENPDGARKKYRFASKLSVEKYIREEFPGADIDSFFSSFTWKIRAKPSLINGKDQNLLPPPLEEIAEPSMNESQCDGVGCKAGNKMCGNLLVEEKSQSAVMPCDICCTEPGFCRDCCCILCSQSTSSCKGCYSYIKCEALVSEGCICGHIAHVNCALQTYMAGTVGGSIGLDAEYYCRRCDARTDLIPYCVGLLETCKSVDSQDELEKILNVGMCILNGSEKTDAKALLNRFEMAIIKLKCGTIMEDIWKTEEDASPITSVPPSSGNATLSPGGDVAQGVADCQDVLSNRVRLQGVVSPSLDCQAETLKLEDEIDQVLQELQKSQEYEYKIAEERLYAQKKFLQNLYQQLEKEKSDYLHHKADSSAGDLWTVVLHRVDQINEEVTKLKDMERVAIGFGRLQKSIRRKHFGLKIQK